VRMKLNLNFITLSTVSRLLKSQTSYNS